MATRTVSVRVEVEVDTTSDTAMEGRVLDLVIRRLEGEVEAVVAADPRTVRIAHVGTVVRARR